jgi:predicted Zn-dependent protease
MTGTAPHRIVCQDPSQGIGYVAVAENLFAAGQFAAAEQQILRALRCESQIPDWHGALGRVRLALGRRWAGPTGR